MAKGKSDTECNRLSCLWDGNDCDGVASSQDKDRRPTYFKVGFELNETQKILKFPRVKF